VLALVSELLERLRDPDVRALEVRQGDVRVSVSRDAARAPAAAEPAAAEVAATMTPKPAPAAAKPPGNAITAPLTGVFYRSASPQAPPFVQVGTVVSPGDVIGLIEAMKLFNEVRSTVAGRVRRIAAENGQLVRAHQPLLELE
jgi:acetyl-CoA carboxylase biotin carboxyl carrier protein